MQYTLVFTGDKKISIRCHFNSEHKLNSSPQIFDKNMTHHNQEFEHKNYFVGFEHTS